MRNQGLILGQNIENLSRSEQHNAIKHYAPAFFADSPASSVSDRYSFLNSMDVVNNLMNLGWNPTHVHVNNRGMYGQHMIRMTHEGLNSKVVGKDGLIPQLIFSNSHDGTQRAKLDIGAFRLVCSNGLVVGEKGAYDSIKVKHIGMNQNDFIDLTEQFYHKFDNVFPLIEEMQNTIISPETQVYLAMLALVLKNPQKYALEDGITPNVEYIGRAHRMSDILRPKRIEDEAPNLWNTFNKIEEKITKGEFHKFRVRGENRNCQPRPIVDAQKNLDFHTKFWCGATELMNNEPNLENALKFKL